MGAFLLCLNALCLAGQAGIHLAFAARFTGRPVRARHCAAYFLLLCGAGLLCARLRAGAAVAACASLLALYGFCRLALKSCRPVSLLAAVLAVYITQLSLGLVDSVEVVVFPGLVGSPLLYPLTVLAALAALGVGAGCCAAVLRLLSFAKDDRPLFVGLLAVPGLFFFCAELYLLRTAYGTLAASSAPAEAAEHGALLLLQAMGLAALLCTLCAYRRLCRGLEAQEALRSLAQAAQAQRVLVDEARRRCAQTSAFRHDLKNHLSVLDGLLRAGKVAEGRAYLARLEASSRALALPYQTGNAAVDVLLGEKLGLAEEIETEVSLLLPHPCGVDDFDLCVIFANALDNAIAACRACAGARAIRIVGKRQGDFYLLIFENTCADGPPPVAGTGLSNIRAAAEKYHGTVLAQRADGRFSLSVLLDIS